MQKDDTKIGQKYGKILKVGVNSTSMEQVLRFVAARFNDKEKFYIVTPNPEIVLKAYKSPFLARIISDADISVPDGVGLRYAARFIDGTKLNIIPGKKLFWEILKIANKKKLKIVLFGGMGEDSQKAKEQIEKNFKGLEVLAVTPPLYDDNASPINKEEREKEKKVFGRVKIFQPDLIFVGLTTPKQESWIRKHFFNFPTITGAMTVGDTFAYVGGVVKNPPEWLEQSGFEWFFRLLTQPKRIKRILNATVIFPIKIVLWKFGMGKK